MSMVFVAPEPSSKPTNHALVMSQLSDSGEEGQEIHTHTHTHGRRQAFKHVVNVVKGSILYSHPGSNYVFLGL